jgi:hypothetical protein
MEKLCIGSTLYRRSQNKIGSIDEELREGILFADQDSEFAQ